MSCQLILLATMLTCVSSKSLGEILDEAVSNNNDGVNKTKLAQQFYAQSQTSLATDKGQQGKSDLELANGQSSGLCGQLTSMVDDGRGDLTPYSQWVCNTLTPVTELNLNAVEEILEDIAEAAAVAVVAGVVVCGIESLGGWPWACLAGAELASLRQNETIMNMELPEIAVSSPHVDHTDLRWSIIFPSAIALVGLAVLVRSRACSRVDKHNQYEVMPEQLLA